MTEEQRERAKVERSRERRDRWRYEIAGALKVKPGSLTEDGDVAYDTGEAWTPPPHPVFALEGVRYTVVADGSPWDVPAHWEWVGYSFGWILLKGTSKQS